MNEIRAAKMVGAPEWRGIDDYEIRKSADGNEFVVRGHAALFASPYPVSGGPEKGGWIERVDKRAFDVTLASKPDVHFLINHEGVTLARTKSGTLTLTTDAKGLLSEARIDRRDPMGQSLEVKMERGDLDEMSFAFRTVRQNWDADYIERDLLEVNIDKGDVSVVNHGANEATRISIRSLNDSLQMLTNADLAEVRSALDNPMEQLRELRSTIDEMLREMTPKEKRKLTFDEAAALVASDGGRRVSDRTAALMFDPKAAERRKAQVAKVDAEWRAILDS
jgi:HK97 family phage prohead protease